MIEDSRFPWLPGSQLRVRCPACGKAICPKNDGTPRAHLGRRGTKHELSRCPVLSHSDDHERAP